ncbi:glycosyltransferase family 4 protein [Methylomonas sp. 2BW1-5-20]|uniref:glycosyltransferase family 4 protein n=1 Tax=Methylomonas sp. 2BW1-5-20 TaxID=3376686 RepID=UPI00404F7857
MNILIVSDSYPAFDRSSYELRFSRFVQILAQTHQVTLCPLDVPYMRQELGEAAVNFYRHALIDQEVKVADSGLVSALKSDSFDTVIFILFVTATPKNIAAVHYWAPKARLVIDSVDVQFGRYQSKARLTQDKRDLDHAEQVKLEELAAYREADFIIVVSEPERQLLLPELPQKRIGIIPNIHPMGEFTPTYARDGKSLLFVGWGAYGPNVDAVLYFTKEVLPLVLKEIPQACLKVVGGDYPEEVINLNGGAVEILGRVPEMQPYLLNAYISVAPLRYGSGVKGKIGEALSYGLPVVTTSIGLEGFGLTPGKDVLVGDTPQDLANHIINLLRDPVLHSKISLSGRQFLESNFSEAVVKNRIIEQFIALEAAPRPWLTLLWRRLKSFLRQQAELHLLWRFRT